jgi:hypothetical protein
MSNMLGGDALSHKIKNGKANLMMVLMFSVLDLFHIPPSIHS